MSAPAGVEDPIGLNDGRSMPRLGFGTYKITGADAEATIGRAIRAGYAALDTAAFYDNEEAVGAAVRAAPAGRDALFVTTKIWNDDHGFDETLAAFARSRDRLGVGPVDLVLIHWPLPRRNRFVDTWRALIDLRRQGLVRSIGVSNFQADHLEALVAATGIVPAVNQVELHPRFQQRALQAVHRRLGIATACWSPLGRARFLNEPAILGVAARHGCSAAQVVLAWHLQNGFAPIPKSATPARIAENRDLAGLHLDGADMAAVDALDDPDGRMGPDPAHFG